MHTNDQKIFLAVTILAIVVFSGQTSFFDGKNKRKAGPRLMFKHKTETVSDNGSKVTRYPVFNAGNRRLIIRETGSCCGTTPNTLIIPPGTTRTLQLNSRSEGNALVRFSTNDHRNPFFELNAGLRPGPLTTQPSVLKTVGIPPAFQD